MKTFIFWSIITLFLSCNLFINEDEIRVKVNSDFSLNLQETSQFNRTQFEKRLNQLIEEKRKEHEFIKIRFEVDPDTEIGFVKIIKNVLSYHRDYSLMYLPPTKPFSTGKIFRLPPPHGKNEPDISFLKPRNVAQVHIKSNGQVLYEEQIITKEFLQDSIYFFLKSDTTKKHLPELRLIELNGPGKVLCASKSIVSLTADKETRYEDYSRIYDLLRGIYVQLWDEYADKYYGKDYEDLKNWEQKVIKKILPYVLSET